MLTDAPSSAELAGWIERQLQARNEVSRAFFPAQAQRLAAACKIMAERFLRGGRLLAFGRDAAMTDAQHVSVEFVHPVIVGKRALPALDLSAAFGPWVAALATADDIVMGFGPPGGDPEVERVVAAARARGAYAFSLPGSAGDFSVDAPSPDPYVSQELIEVLYHTLWESVHVFFEHREMGHNVGASAFLYPYLGKAQQDVDAVVPDVAASIVMKTQDDERLRAEVAATQAQAIAGAATAMAREIAAGGKLILFGNGGSATDANDWALDCIMPPAGERAIPAVSLSMEPANITAIANDVGKEVIFLRQFIAQARPHDIAVGISTSGGSSNVVMALEEARKRGLLTVALLGYDGGDIVRRKLADHALVVRCDYIPRIQEVQASIYHIMRAATEKALPRGG